MPKKEEQPVVRKEDRQDRFTREWLERDKMIYREYWLSLSPRDQERFPQP